MQSASKDHVSVDGIIGLIRSVHDSLTSWSGYNENQVCVVLKVALYLARLSVEAEFDVFLCSSGPGGTGG